MHTKFTKILILAGFLLATTISSAQNFTNYTTAEGLINNSVNCLVVDANDHLWFGTQEGISKFDGTTWTSIDLNSHPDLVHNTILAIEIDADGNLWVGTDFGVGKYDGTNWTTYTEADGLADNRIKYIRQDTEGNIWFGNNDGVSVFDGTDWMSYTMADGLPFGGINFITFDAAGNKWFGTGLGGVLMFDGTTFTEITEDEGLLSDKIRSIAIDENNYKWVGTSDGVSVLGDDNQFAFDHEFIFTLPPPDSLNPIEDIQIDSKGRIWVGVYVDYLVTEGGVSMYDGNTWVQYEVPDGLVGPVVRRLAIDTQDNVWVATSSGVTKISDVPMSIFDEEVRRNIKVFPNPASDFVNLTVPEDLIDATYSLYNYMGIEVKTGLISEEMIQVELADIAKGFYLINFRKGGEVFAKKVVIE